MSAVVALALLAATVSAQSDQEPVIQGPPAPIAPEVVSRDDSGRATVRATRIPEPLVLDGRLDEPAYTRVPPIDGFIQQEPRAGEPATEPTDVWVFFDDDNVYVSARCWDSHPERIIANEMRRDNGNIFQNDTFTVVLDTFYDQRNGFFFQTNPLGALRDQAVGDEGEANSLDWNTVWNIKAAIDDQAHEAVPALVLFTRSTEGRVRRRRRCSQGEPWMLVDDHGSLQALEVDERGVGGGVVAPRQRHPVALCLFDAERDKSTIAEIDDRTRGPQAQLGRFDRDDGTAER